MASDIGGNPVRAVAVHLLREVDVAVELVGRAECSYLHVGIPFGARATSLVAPSERGRRARVKQTPPDPDCYTISRARHERSGARSHKPRCSPSRSGAR